MKKNIIVLFNVRGTLRASYAPYSWYFGPDSSKAYIECEASIYYYTINLTKIYVARSGKTTSGIATITADVIPPDPGGSKAYYGEVVFSTTSNQAAGQFNSGNAGVEAEVKLDGEVKASKTSTTYSNFTGAVTVTYPDCADAPPCDGEPVPPTIEVQIQPNGFGGLEGCNNRNNHGYFGFPIGADLINHKENTFDVCFNNEIGKWQFKVDNPVLNVVKDICIENLNSHNYNVKSSLLDVEADEICEALYDLAKYYNYPVEVEDGDIVFLTILMAHENEHYNEFMDSSFTPNMSNFDAGIESLNNQFNCNKFDSPDDAKSSMQFLYKKKVDDYLQVQIINYAEGNGMTNKTKNIKLAQERVNHSKIKGLFDTYIFVLSEQAKTYGINCF